MRLLNIPAHTLKSFSERLRFHVKKKEHYNDYTIAQVNADNSRHNLALFLAQLVAAIDLRVYTKDDLCAAISNFNELSDTNVTLEDLLSCGWVHFEFDQVVIPRMIAGYVHHEAKNGGPAVDKSDEMVKCLAHFLQSVARSERCFVSEETIAEVFLTGVFPGLTRQVLLEKGILHKEDTGKIYLATSAHLHILGPQIAALLWSQLLTVTEPKVRFKKFAVTIRRCCVVPFGITSFLNIKDASELLDSIWYALEDEPNLQNQEQLLQRVWFASKDWRYVKQTPTAAFDLTTPLEVIRSFEYHKFRFHESFETYLVFSFYRPFIKLVLEIEGHARHEPKFNYALRFLKGTTRPLLLWQTYELIREEYPWLAPYLLIDHELSPFAFQVIERFTFNDALLIRQPNELKGFEEREALNHKLWLEQFDLYIKQLSLSRAALDLHSNSIIEALLDTTKRAVVPAGLLFAELGQELFRGRFDDAIKILYDVRECHNTPDSIELPPRVIIPFLRNALPRVAERFDKRRPAVTNHLSLVDGLFFLAIDMLRLSNLPIPVDDLHKEIQEKIEAGANALLQALYQHTCRFYEATTVEKIDYFNDADEPADVYRDGVQSGYSSADWAYLYLSMQEVHLLQPFFQRFLRALKFDKSKDQRQVVNRGELTKVNLFLRSIVWAYLDIQTDRSRYEVDSLPLSETLAELEEIIVVLSLCYSSDNPQAGNFDAFSERFVPLDDLAHTESLVELVFACIDYFEPSRQEDFARRFFKGSTDLARMLAAINTVADSKLVAQLSTLIKNINVEEFIRNTWSTVEIQAAALQAVNSDAHWQLTRPLMEAIGTYLERIKYYDDNTFALLFEIKLLLKYKEEDIEGISGMDLPFPSNVYVKKQFTNLRYFYEALYYLFVADNIGEAVKRLEYLVSEDPLNIRYRVHLFTAHVLLSAGQPQGIIDAFDHWEDFEDNLSEGEQFELDNYEQPIFLNKLYYYAATDNEVEFNSTLQRLNTAFKFEEDAILLVSKYFCKKESFAAEREFLEKARQYYTDNNLPISDQFAQLLMREPDGQLIVKIAQHVRLLPTLGPADLPKVIPPAFNGQSVLNDFVCEELLRALEVVLDKRQIIAHIQDEDRHTDLLVAVLKPRFGLFRWDIGEQTRLGDTDTRKNAGRADLTFNAAGRRFALGEAFVLHGRDSTKTHKHLVKLESYGAYTICYFALVYYRGKPGNFQHAWDTYKADVRTAPFSPTFAFDVTHDLLDIKAHFGSRDGMEIALSKHGSGLQVYHIMVNFKSEG